MTVPLVMRWPRHIPAGTRRSEIINLVDLSAALVEACGGVPLTDKDGRSLLPLALGRDIAGQNETFSEYCTDVLLTWARKVVARIRMIRSDHWKYIRYNGCGPQLFDLGADPDEMVNLAGVSRFAEVETRLRDRLPEDWDPVETENHIRGRAAAKAILRGGRSR